MPSALRRRLAAFPFLALLVATPASPSPEGEAIAVGLDHVIVAVEDLEAAARRYRDLGFVLKEGRPHDNGIRNRHVKFSDGSEIELLTAPEARDPLTATYRRHLAAGGDGPAFAGLFAPTRPALLAALSAAGAAPRDQGLITFPEGPFRPLFFGSRNASLSDRPEHFAHPNGATALVGVWLAPDDPAAMVALLEAVGGVARDEVLAALSPEARATVLELPEGFVAVVDPSLRRHPDRAVLGVTVTVRDLDAAAEAIGPRADAWRLEGAPRRLVVPATHAHGLTLELRESAELHRGATPSRSCRAREE